MWPRPAAAERRDPDGHQTRVGYILRRSGFERHCGIVSRICLAKGGGAGEPTTVLTASRDGTLKCWDIPASNETHGGSTASSPPAGLPAARLRSSLEEHTGWVNDCVVLPNTAAPAHGGRDTFRAVSASNDNLVKVWQIPEERLGTGLAPALLSLRYHVDYVTCLAYAPHRALLASGGLDARTVVADLEAATRVLTLQGGDGQSPLVVAAPMHRSSPSRGTSGSSSATRCSVGQFSGSGQYVPQLLTPAGAAGGRDSGTGHDLNGRSNSWEQEGSTGPAGASVWSLAMTRSASLLVSGTASCTVRGWDPRSGTRLWRLRGHTENVRALVLSDDGTVCVSGGADRTVRVWDLGTRRCIHVFEAHHDSVWALAVAGYSCGYASPGVADTAGAGGSLTEVFSGGRDGLLLAHDLRLMQTGIVAREASSVQAIAVPPDGGDLWAAAGDSHVRRHVVPNLMAPYAGPVPGLAGCAAGSSPLAGDAAPPPGATPLSPGPTLHPAAASSSDDRIAIRGTPRLTDYRVLDNKRQVLTRDACDQFALWDVTTGQCVDVLTPAMPREAAATPGSRGAEEVMRKVLAQVNRPVSVPTWFACDVALGSLTVYLDASSCFKAESDEADAAPLSVIPVHGGVAGLDRLQGRNGAHPPASPVVNLGVQSLRALFAGWVRAPPVGSTGSGGTGDRHQGMGSSRGGSPGPRGRPQSAPKPRAFAPAPAAQESPGARRWDDDQPPGTPTDAVPTGSLVPGPAHSTLGGGTAASASPATFPPSTALVLVSRTGRPVGFRGRLYCGYLSGTETPDLLPPWVVDLVWNQAPPPEELLGERVLLFSLARCPTEYALPVLPNGFCAAAPRTPIRRLMGYLVRTVDFDWSAPPKLVPRRPNSAGLVSRLARCCVAPSAGRGATAAARSNSGDSFGGDSSDGESPAPAGATGAHTAGAPATKSGRSHDRERAPAAAPLAAPHGSTGASRRHFGLRSRSEEETSAPPGLASRVFIDTIPPAAGAAAPGRGSSAAPSSARGSAGAAAAAAAALKPAVQSPDELWVEITCNGVVVDPGSSLATVRDFVWRKPGTEMLLCYRRSARSAPVPVQALMVAGPKEQVAGVEDAVASEGRSAAVEPGSGGAWGGGLGGRQDSAAGPPSAVEAPSSRNSLTAPKE